MFKAILIAALFAVSGAASAHLIVGYGQVTSSSSASQAGTIGGSVAIGDGAAASQSYALGVNGSAANATQTLGVTTTTTGSVSYVEQGNISASVGNAGAGAFAGSTADGAADAIGGQGFIFFTPGP